MHQQIPHSELKPNNDTYTSKKDTSPNTISEKQYECECGKPENRGIPVYTQFHTPQTWGCFIALALPHYFIN